MLCFLNGSCAGRKVGLLTWRVRRKVLSREIKNCTPLWRKAPYEVKMLKNSGSGSTFWSSDVEKLHAAVAKANYTFWSSDVEKLHAALAKSAFWSQNAQNTSCSEHFLKFWCRKIARRCGEKHILKWKCTKHVGSGQFFEVLMSKNFMNLWREARLAVKMYKILVFWRLFQIQMSNN